MPPLPVGRDREDRDGEEDERECQLDVAQAHQDGVGPAPEEPSDKTDHETEGGAKENRPDTDQERVARAVDQSAEEITAEGIGAEWVAPDSAILPDRRFHTAAEVLRQGIVRCDERRKNGDQHDQSDPE